MSRAEVHSTHTPQSSSILWKVSTAPINISFSLLSGGFSVLRPYAPTIVPVFVFSLFIPLILLLSALSGWFVWSSLSVSWKVPLYLQYGDGVAPYAYVALPNLAPGQRYNIAIDLILPCTEPNTNLGNFMTTLTLSAPNNKTLAYVRRSAIALPAKSLFLFSTPITTRLKVPLIESFTASRSDMVAAVEIGRRDSWTTLGLGHGREVSIVSASLIGLAVPHGIRGLAMRFPLLASLASAGIFVLILSSILGTCVLPLLLPVMPSEDKEGLESNLKQEQIPPSASQYPAQERERRRRSRSEKRSKERKIKVEAPVQTIPSVSEGTSRGLRRRSSRHSIPSDEDSVTPES
ncbi:hypothetical protein BJ912DRAFT_208655 [Pholiota molesta]|nr:hypothetical protein BJ912DRAFT_208655 [Pholiota molesta]